MGNIQQHYLQAINSARSAYSLGRHEAVDSVTAALIIGLATLPEIGKGEKLHQWVARNFDQEIQILSAFDEVVKHYFAALPPMPNSTVKILIAFEMFNDECNNLKDRASNEFYPKTKFIN